MNATTEAPDDEAEYAGEESAEFEEPGSWHGHGQQSSDGHQAYPPPGAWNQGAPQDGPWKAAGSGEWRAPGGPGQMDELSRALGGLDIQHPQPQPSYPQGGPRFNPNARQPSPNLQQPYIDPQQNAYGGRRLQLYTDVNAAPANHGPVSASAYVPPIGHGTTSPPLLTRTVRLFKAFMSQIDDPLIAVYRGRSEASLAIVSLVLATRTPTFLKPTTVATVGANLETCPHLRQFQPSTLTITAIITTDDQEVTAEVETTRGAYGGSGSQGTGVTIPTQPQLQPGNPATYLASPIDVPTMISQKGYNPATFDIKPAFVSTSESAKRIAVRSVLTGSLLRDQIVHRGRCPQVAQVRDLEFHRPRKQAFGQGF